MELKAGARLASITCDTQVVVVKAPSGDVDVRCGGESMVPLGEESARKDLAADEAEGTLAGKRYTNEDGSIELLCTKAGAGSISVDGQRVSLKDAKPLPSSD